MYVFKGRSKFFYLYLFLLGVVNSLMYTVTLVFINNAITGEGRSFFSGYDYLFYMLVVMVSLAASRLFKTYIVRLTNEIINDFELNVLQKVRLSFQQSFEKVGLERIYSGVSEARIIGQLPEILINSLNATVIILCAVCYLFTVSLSGAALIVSLMIALLAFYLYRNKGLKNDFAASRELQDKYYKYLLDLLAGIKEVKMSQLRSRNIYEVFIRKNREESKALNIKILLKNLDNEITGNFSWYAVLGITIFALPHLLDVSIAVVAPFVVTILLLMTNVYTLITCYPFFTKIKLIIQRVQRLEKDLDGVGTESINIPEAVAGKEFDNIEFRDVTYSHTNPQGKSLFALGPFNFCLSRGETVFVTGGNGSGKSTFFMLLTGLYRPTSGVILWNGEEVTMERWAHYRDNIAAIFTRDHLFSENYTAFDLSVSNEKLNRFIHLMKMEGVLQVKEGAYSLMSGLSKGQQKRLAMILALMEDREVMVFDEWAAEQDPGFRKYFYTEFLRYLKSAGKTVVIVTHDDDYFIYADRLIKLDFGRLSEVGAAHKMSIENE